MSVSLAGSCTCRRSSRWRCTTSFTRWAATTATDLATIEFERSPPAHVRGVPVQVPREKLADAVARGPMAAVDKRRAQLYQPKLGADGQPIKGALISTHDDTYTDDAFTRALGDLFPTNATSKKTRTNGKGRFKIMGLTPTNYQIRIQAPGHSREVRKDVRVSEDRDTDLGALQLTAGGGVTGLVVDQAGQPVVGARVTLRADGGSATFIEPRETKSASNGRYSFPNVPAGNYKIMAMRADPGDDVFGGLVDQERSEQRVSVREGQDANIDMRIGG